MIDRFIGAVLGDATPVVTGAEARWAVEIASGAMLSAVHGRTVDLPVDRGAYDALFDDLVAGRAALPRLGPPSP